MESIEAACETAATALRAVQWPITEEAIVDLVTALLHLADDLGENKADATGDPVNGDTIIYDARKRYDADLSGVA